MSKGIPLSWVKHLKKQEEKDRFEQTVRASTTALYRLIDLINEKESDLNNSELTEDDFSKTDWAYKQAFRNGKKAALKEIRQLLEFLKD